MATAADVFAAHSKGRGMSDKSPAHVSVGEIDLSVVIPAYGGIRTIADCLASVRRATLNRRAEVIVVESSGDGAATIIREQFPEVVLIESPQRLSAGQARNRGMHAARGRLVYCVDQDCVVPPDWIERLGRHMSAPDVGAAGGSVGIADPGNLSGAAVYFLEFFRHLPSHAPAVRNRNFLVGCNSVYRAEVLAGVQVPDRTLGEDVVFSHSIRADGWDVVYDPRVEVLHRNRRGWGEFFRYNRAMGRAAARYHAEIGPAWAAPFLKWPMLIYAAPVVILPTVAWRLACSRWSYLAMFCLLSPMCLLGNLVWAHAFRLQVLQDRKCDQQRQDR